MDVLYKPYGFACFILGSELTMPRNMSFWNLEREKKINTQTDIRANPRLIMQSVFIFDMRERNEMPKASGRV